MWRTVLRRREKARKAREEELERWRAKCGLPRARKVFSREQRLKSLDNKYNSYMRR